jgi:anti-anti-sigma regulatory factor
VSGVKISRKGKFCVVCPGGDLSMIEDSSRLSEQLATLFESGDRTICIDLMESPVINSSVIGTLLRFHEKAVAEGGEFVVLNARNVALESMLRTRMNQVIRFVRSEEEL